MTDVAKELREHHAALGFSDSEETWLTAAADEIERLREALRPFACHCDDGTCTEYIKPLDKAKEFCESYIARAALGEGKE